MPVTLTNLDDVFTYHPPTEAQRQDYGAIREAAKTLAKEILTRTLPCGDQQAALRLLRETVMTANAAVALKGII